MTEITFSSLRDKALDVDSDLRFMALEDFKKVLNEHNTVNIENFVPFLYKLLEDTNPDVKSQTIKTFPIIMPFISESARLEIITKQFNNVITNVESSGDGFTTSVANLVLKAIFNSSYKFSNKSSRTILTFALPQLVDKDLNADLMELLIDVIKSFGQFIEFNEFLALTNFLVNLSFSKINNSISKKAINALESLLKNCSLEKNAVDAEIFDSFLMNVSMNFEKSSKDYRFITNRLVLVSVFVKGSSFLHMTLTPTLVQEIYALIESYLEVSILDEEFDFDKILEDNAIKELSLNILIGLIDVVNFETFEPFLERTKHILFKFIDYDPTSNDDDDIVNDEDEDEDDDIEFSDEDDELETEFNSDVDDGSWKLRFKSIVTIKSLALNYPILLGFCYDNFFNTLVGKISDKNEFIFKQAIETLNLFVTLTDDSEFKQEYLDAIEKEIANNLTNETIVSFIKLVDSLLKFSTAQFSDHFFVTLFTFLLSNPKNFELIEVLSLINALALKIHISSLPSALVADFINKLCELLSLNSNIVLETLKIFNSLVKKLDAEANPETVTIIEKLTSKFKDSKLLIDIKIELINSICEYASDIKLSDEQFESVVEILESSVNYDFSLRYVLVNLNDKLLFPSSANYDRFTANARFCTKIRDSALLCLSSNNKIVYTQALKTMTKLPTPVDASKLLNFATQEGYNEVNALNSVFAILESKVASDELDSEAFLQNFIQLINQIDDDDNLETNIKIEPLVVKLSTVNTFQFLKQKLNLNKTLSIRILSLMTLNLNLSNEIEKNENRIKELIAQKQYNEEFNRIVQYMGFVGLGYNLTTLNLNELVDLLSCDINETTKLTISKAIGLLSKSQPNYLVEAFKVEKLKPYILVSIKEFLQHFENVPIANELWKMLLDEVNVNHINKEFQLVGQSLAIILFQHDSKLQEFKNLLKLDQSSVGLVYTLLIMTNQVINHSSDEFLIKELIQSSLKFVNIVNIEIKILVVKNLINVIHNHSRLFIEDLNSITPNLFDQLRAFDEFKKVIPMGPYKYVIDEGLEIRKLIFELIYSIVNNDTVNFDHEYFIQQIIERGLTDNEFDIINLSYINLIKLIQVHPEFLTNQERMSTLVTNLTKNLNKKLKSKATTQEIEVFQESLKNLINLANVINTIVVRHNWSHAGWEEYYRNVKEHK